jgi:hypothetical protein
MRHLLSAQWTNLIELNIELNNINVHGLIYILAMPFSCR